MIARRRPEDTRPTTNRHRVAVVLGGVAVAMATGGCGSAPTTPPPTAPYGTAGQSPDLASRLKLAEADPCRILAKDAARLGVGPGNLVTSSAALGGQACRLTNFPDKPDSTPGETYLVQMMDGPGALTPDEGAIPPIAGRPTKRGTPSGTTADNTCVEVLDLTADTAASQSAPGQPAPRRYLWVQYSNLARDNPTLTHQAACDTAATAADAAITSLNQTTG